MFQLASCNMYVIVETVNDLFIIFITFDKKYLFDTEKGGLHHVYSNILFCLISFPFILLILFLSWLLFILLKLFYLWNSLPFLGVNEVDAQSVFERGTSESHEHERGNVTSNLCILLLLSYLIFIYLFIIYNNFYWHCTAYC